jgi:hypothetical protein
MPSGLTNHLHDRAMRRGAQLQSFLMGEESICAPSLSMSAISEDCLTAVSILLLTRSNSVLSRIMTNILKIYRPLCTDGA